MQGVSTQNSQGSMRRLYRGWAAQAGAFSLLLILTLLCIPLVSLKAGSTWNPYFLRGLSLALICNAFFGKLFRSWGLNGGYERMQFISITDFLHSLILFIVGFSVVLALVMPRT